MKGQIQRLLAFIVLIATIFTFIRPVQAEYNNTNVYTVVDGTKYYMNGTKLMKGQEVVYDFAALRFKENDFEITADMAKSMLVTDLTHDTWEETNIIYGVALMFKVDLEYQDHADAELLPSRIGIPYMVVLSYKLGDSTIEGYYEDTNAGVEGNAKLEDIMDRLDPEISKSKDMDQIRKFYSFADKLIAPRIIMSKYLDHTAYILYGDQKSNGVTKRHVKVESLNTSRNKPKTLFLHQFYVSFDYLRTTFKKYSKEPFDIDPQRFYIKENNKHKIVLYNFDSIMALAIENDISVYGKPRHIMTYWQYTNKLPIPKQ